MKNTDSVGLSNMGGPAFPVEPAHNYVGMTLRDYFAAAAMTGLCVQKTMGSPEYFAHEAYSLADAMLQERNETRQLK